MKAVKKLFLVPCFISSLITRHALTHVLAWAVALGPWILRGHCVYQSIKLSIGKMPICRARVLRFGSLVVFDFCAIVFSMCDLVLMGKFDPKIHPPPKKINTLAQN